jgi:hypothetical protein
MQVQIIQSQETAFHPIGRQVSAVMHVGHGQWPLRLGGSS